MDHAKHIGRVGALAVALGVGMGVATTPGVAWATADTDNAAASTSAPDLTKTPAANTTPDTGRSSTPPSTASDPTTSPSTTPATASATTVQSPSETTQTNPVAPDVVVRSSGGALTSDSYSDDPLTKLQTPPAEDAPAGDRTRSRSTPLSRNQYPAPTCPTGQSEQGLSASLRRARCAPPSSTPRRLSHRNMIHRH